jgi:DNA-nicking Smr family endonuclease
MVNDDRTLFHQEMGDVVPLKREHRVALGGGPLDDRDSSLAERRQAAVAAPEADRNILNDREAEPLDPWYVLDFKRPGVQNGVYRKLRQGRYEQEARLDLHRMTVRVARKELFDFI